MFKTNQPQETMNKKQAFNIYMNKKQATKTNQPKETMTIKPISKNNVILKKGDDCTFSTFTNDYPNLHLNQKITIADVYDNGVVCVDNGTNIQVNVLANQIDKD